MRFFWRFPFVTQTLDSFEIWFSKVSQFSAFFIDWSSTNSNEKLHPDKKLLFFNTKIWRSRIFDLLAEPQKILKNFLLETIRVLGNGVRCALHVYFGTIPWASILSGRATPSYSSSLFYFYFFTQSNAPRKYSASKANYLSLPQLTLLGTSEFRLNTNSNGRSSCADLENEVYSLLNSNCTWVYNCASEFVHTCINEPFFFILK